MKFSEMSLSEATNAALREMKYIEPTEVQEKTIPRILEGKEIMVRSQTGTGKTAAFGVGLIEQIAKDHNKKALILCPTRELALQVSKELRAISKHHRLHVHAIYGGQDMGVQLRSLERGWDIVVATPGRLMDHAQRRTIHLSRFNLIVLDEADRMLDMGFREDIFAILKEVSEHRQIMLFSATLGSDIQIIARRYLHSPEIMEVGPEEKVETIEEEFVRLSRREKLDRLKEILRKKEVTRAIVFVGTQRWAEFVCHRLYSSGIDTHFLHGGKSQNQRERVMQGFREGRFRILVATDVAARGLHIENVSHIINYDEANSADTHTHRIGRTGRMGKNGKAITFLETDASPRRMGNGESHGTRHGGYGHGRDREGGYGRDRHSSYRPQTRRKGYDPYQSAVFQRR